MSESTWWSRYRFRRLARPHRPRSRPARPWQLSNTFRSVQRREGTIFHSLLVLSVGQNGLRLRGGMCETTERNENENENENGVYPRAIEPSALWACDRGGRRRDNEVRTSGSGMDVCVDQRTTRPSGWQGTDNGMAGHLAPI